MAKSVEVKDGICYMCTMTCPTKIHVQNGKAVKVDIADPKVAHCPRWKAQLDFIYHPDRLQYPMKRNGKRGNGSWQRISWDEALDTVAGNLQVGQRQIRTGIGRLLDCLHQGAPPLFPPPDPCLRLAQLLHRKQQLFFRHLDSRQPDLRRRNILTWPAPALAWTRKRNAS